MKLWFGCAHQFYVLSPLSPVQQIGGDPSRPDYMPELCFRVCSPCSSILHPSLLYFCCPPYLHPVPLPSPLQWQRTQAFSWIFGFTAPELYASKFLFVINHTDSGTWWLWHRTGKTTRAQLLHGILKKSSSSIVKHGDEVGLRLNFQIFLLCKIAKSRDIRMLSSNEILSRRNNRK